MSEETIKFIKNVPRAQIPTKAYRNDSGFDLYAAETRLIVPGVTTQIDIGISVAFPNQFYGIIFTRSSMGKRGVQLHNGVIDNGYRGKLSVFFYNFGTEFYVHCGDKVGQLLIFKNYPITFFEVDQLPNSERGEKGFGSSGY